MLLPQKFQRAAPHGFVCRALQILSQVVPRRRRGFDRDNFLKALTQGLCKEPYAAYRSQTRPLETSAVTS